MIWVLMLGVVSRSEGGELRSLTTVATADNLRSLLHQDESNGASKEGNCQHRIGGPI